MSDQHHEIVIVRRGGHGDHDEHHGGVWKIAFADFMTAMMAFFLVLWLISANDKTRASVARYFNPVRLVDATTQPRGLHDSKKDESGITSSPDTKTKKDDKKPENTEVPKAPPAPKTKGEDTAKGEAAKGQETPKGHEKRLDAELRDNPYVALAEIVGDKGPGEPAAKDGSAQTPAIGHGGAAFRDPFAPPPPQRLDEADADKDEILDPTPRHAAAPRTDAEDAGAKDGEARKGARDARPKDADAATTLKASLVSALKGSGTDRAGPSLEVRKTSEGTLVSLTDTSDFAMFANGSAVPSKKVVLMMEKIAPLFRDQHGEIVVRGFTDNKKFRGSRYDNWHLSLDRAQVAHYMLVRGGLADARVSHVEGYADHETRSGLDPANPRNRRIEILIKDAPA